MEKSKKTLSLQVEEVKSNPEKCPLCKNEINEHDHKMWVQEKEEELININSNILDKNKQKTGANTKIIEWKEKTKKVEETLNKIKTKINKRKKMLKFLKKK